MSRAQDSRALHMGAEPWNVGMSAGSFWCDCAHSGGGAGGVDLLISLYWWMAGTFHGVVGILMETVKVG